MTDSPPSNIKHIDVMLTNDRFFTLDVDNWRSDGRGFCLFHKEGVGLIFACREYAILFISVNY